MTFVIEDEAHCETVGQFATLAEATAELERLAELPWDAPPNQAPCSNWQSCGRRYELIKYDSSATPWRELSRREALNISSKGAQWL